MTTNSLIVLATFVIMLWIGALAWHFDDMGKGIIKQLDNLEAKIDALDSKHDKA